MKVISMLAILLLLPASLMAQTLLDRVEVLVEADRYQDARSELEEWWSGHDGQPPRTELPRGLWYRALLTIDPSLAEADYRRLVVEFPASPHADEALLRLAKGAQSVGDLAAARRYLDILIQDYAGSPHRIEARALRERLAGEGGGHGRGWVEAQPVPPPAEEVQPQADRTDVAPVAPEPDEPTRDPEEPEAQDPAEDVAEPEVGADDIQEPTETGAYTVQLGAFSTLASARAFAQEVQATGLAVRIATVPESDLFRVRVGRFATEEAARARMRAIGELGFEALISTDGHRERLEG